jgi:hypothetical protein
LPELLTPVDPKRSTDVEWRRIRATVDAAEAQALAGYVAEGREELARLSLATLR